MSTADQRDAGAAEGGGFARVHNSVVERIGEIRFAAFAVYCVLARHCNGGGECWPSVGRIAELIGRKPLRVEIAIKRLARNALVDITPRPSDQGDNDTNLYRLPLLAPSKRGERKCAPVAQESTPPRRNGMHYGGAPDCTQTRPIEKDPMNKKLAPAGAGPSDARVMELIDGWNALGERIVKKGNRGRRDPPAKAVADGWKRSQRDPEHAAAFADIGALMAAIRKARFCHGRPWFNLAWLFGKNKHGEFTAVKLINGGYDDDQETNRRGSGAPGPGQRFDANAAEYRDDRW